MGTSNLHYWMYLWPSFLKHPERKFHKRKNGHIQSEIYKHLLRWFLWNWLRQVESYLKDAGMAGLAAVRWPDGGRSSTVRKEDAPGYAPIPDLTWPPWNSPATTEIVHSEKINHWHNNIYQWKVSINPVYLRPARKNRQISRVKVYALVGTITQWYLT